ncbi:MAG: AIPR family protein [Candidatus Hydrogenedentes bacterium]|nr:AIPR family protein [Candidatus Hydrogenedentota bacterium]
MATKSYRIRAFEARRTTHPVFPEIEKYWLTVKANDFPSKISTAANARDPVGLNRHVYRDVRESLLGVSSVPGTFDLMNKGITILAHRVRLLDKSNQTYEVTVDDEVGGIVDGAHTARLIEEAQEDGNVPEEQHVEVFIRTGIEGQLRTDIAKGLNTGMQVAVQSIYNIGGVFDWLKVQVSQQPYADQISWKESDDLDYDVRDLIGVLEAMNVFDYPNDAGKHPVAAYEKWSVPLQKFGEDYGEYKEKGGKGSKYYRLRGLLVDSLTLYDLIRHDFLAMHNKAGGNAGLLKIVEKASAKRGTFDFPFAPELDPKEYRLTKGATYPILGAFRNFVEVDPKTGEARWRGGFGAVRRAWEKLGPNLIAEVFSATKEIGRLPDQIGKSRKVWTDCHRELGFRLLQQQVAAQK